MRERCLNAFTQRTFTSPGPWPLNLCTVQDSTRDSSRLRPPRTMTPPRARVRSRGFEPEGLSPRVQARGFEGPEFEVPSARLRHRTPYPTPVRSPSPPAPQFPALRAPPNSSEPSLAPSSPGPPAPSDRLASSSPRRKFASAILRRRARRSKRSPRSSRCRTTRPTSSPCSSSPPLVRFAPASTCTPPTFCGGHHALCACVVCRACAYPYESHALRHV